MAKFSTNRKFNRYIIEFNELVVSFIENTLKEKSLV